MSCPKAVAGAENKSVTKQKNTKKVTAGENAEETTKKETIRKKPARRRLEEIKESLLQAQTQKKKEKKVVKWRNKREPAYREDGKYVCPVCLLRDELTILDYDYAGEGKFLFVVGCKRCNVKFKVKKKV